MSVYPCHVLTRVFCLDRQGPRVIVFHTIGDTDAVSIRSKSLNYNYLTISSSSAAWLKVCMIGIIPMGFLLLGVDEVLRRRKKV